MLTDAKHSSRFLFGCPGGPVCPAADTVERNVTHERGLRASFEKAWGKLRSRIAATRLTPVNGGGAQNGHSRGRFLSLATCPLQQCPPLPTQPPPRAFPSPSGSDRPPDIRCRF